MMTRGVHAAARYLKAWHIGKRDRGAASAFASAQSWLDADMIATALKSAAPAYGDDDFGPSQRPVADAFMECVRDYSISARLQGLRRVPLRTRVFVNSSGGVAVQVAQGAPVPILTGSWTVISLDPRKHAGIVVTTNELLESSSPVASAALTTDLAAAVAEGENVSMFSPLESGSVLNGAQNFVGSGSAIAAIAVDLRRLLDLVPAAHRGAAFLVAPQTANYYSTLRTTDGAPCFPGMTPTGGTLIGLPAFVTTACALSGSPSERIVGLVAPSELIYASDDVVRFDVSRIAALQMNTAPSSGAQNQTSLFQTDASGLLGALESNWYARANAGAYFRVSY